MERIKTYQFLRVVLIVLAIGMMWGCAHDGVNDIPTMGEDNDKMVTFTVKIPGAGVPKTPATYALTPNQENEVTQMVVLLFDTEGNFVFRPIYISSSDIETSTSDSKLKTFSIKIPEGTYDIVVLANANESLNSGLMTLNEGMPKASLLGNLLLSNSGRWNATHGSTNYRPIAMWGEVIEKEISGSGFAYVTVTMVRMLAKIDVELTSVSAKANFNLQSVRLYNYTNEGQIVPYETNWNSETSVVTGPSIPFTAIVQTTPLLYDGVSIKKEGGRGVSSLSEIYTFESLAGTSSALTDNTCLVIGGIYDGDSQATYYRIDFVRQSAAGGSGEANYLPLLRNHNYKINIVDVKGRGLSTPDEAFNASPENIDANVMIWDDAQITNIAFNGDYMLGVSQDAFSFTREVRNNASEDNRLFVTTDYATGWKVEKIVDAYGYDINSATTSTSGWISLAPSSGASGSTTSTRLILKENVTTAPRIGFVHLSAGPLTYIVKVEQSIKVKVGLSIAIADRNDNSINTLVFGTSDNTQPMPQLFKLSWTPAESSLTFLLTSEGDAFDFATGAGIDVIPPAGAISDPTGTKTIAVMPTIMPSEKLAANPFYERSSKVLYTISDDTEAVYRTLTLRQVVYNMIPVVQPVYRMDGGQTSFGVRTNVPFEVTVKSDPNNVIELLTIGGDANTTEQGARVSFRIKDDFNNPTVFQANVVVTISSPDNLFPDEDITLNCLSAIVKPEANSYIVAPSDYGIMIPVARANKSLLGSQLGANDTFTTEVVWTDNANRVAANSNIRVVKTSGVGSAAHVVVMPGSAQGNAVVAIKNGNGKILWSWHIWVTNYAPLLSSSTNTAMDRNLGAVGNTPGGVNTKGLLYQWGRKDPFPSSTSISGNTEPVIYNATGTTTINKVATPNTSAPMHNIGNSVANPATFYQGASVNSTDWYSNKNNTHNDALWGGGGTKSIYDPCPDGWRVPKVAVWNGLTNANFPWDGAVLGNTNSNYGVFFPAAGHRQANGNITDVGGNGYYWSASVVGERAQDLYFGRTNPVSPGSNMRGYAYSVRCVKE